MPGSLIRATVKDGPLARDVGDSVWNFYEYDNVMVLTDSSSVAVRYPSARSRDWFVSRFERGAEQLGRTAVVADETYERGRVVSFAGEPNFRGFTDGTQKILWNVIYGRDPAPTSSNDKTVVTERAMASRFAERLIGYDGKMVVTVRADVAAETESLLEHYGLTPPSHRFGHHTMRYLVEVKTAEDSPFARRLVGDLAHLGSGVLAVRVP